MKTLESVSAFMEIFARYHPEYSHKEIRSMYLEILKSLPEAEVKRFLEEYYKWADERYAEEFPDEYVDGYRESEDYWNTYISSDEAP